MQHFNCIKDEMKFKIALFFLFFILMANCASKKNNEGFEEKSIEPDAQKKAKEFVEKGGGFLENFNKNSKNTFEFSTSNVLWRATLKSLDFLPLVNADYSGGIVIYDWYGNTENSNDQIKISIRFLNNELRSDSLEVIIHKKNCINLEKCITKKIDDNLNREIKDKILNTARIIKIEESKKDKK